MDNEMAGPGWAGSWAGSLEYPINILENFALGGSLRAVLGG